MTKNKPYKWIEKELKFINDITGKQKKNLARAKRFTKQYEKQGWSDMDTWNLDFRFAEWIVPRLRRFIELNNGFPGGNDDGMTEKKWLATLKEMLEGFEFMASDDYYGSCDKKKHAKADKALELFGRWARHLWW